MKNIQMTEHAKERALRRAIDARQIEIALRYGIRGYTHNGIQTFTLTDRVLLHSPYAREVDRLRGLHLLLSPGGAVITLFKKFTVSRKPGIARKSQLLRRVREREERHLGRDYNC